ncbi:cell wall metabolism sensor histidine kinase WalK [Niallia sp. NCCP-28]|uniref:sensor histidine kinase n=1 Tax=Niallia sp. NCCP-28 TaxID=2934712 RepID=UPI002082BB7D|nr:HAMP domain-containing sensor histidine kinase [Niallia sp. NCCP-28]GKU85213.1 two-component sensor histidine kinase [Niallia sp. NCCP-28]
MFRKTRIKLTMLNSLVFIVLMIVLGILIYHYTEKQIYSDVNRSLIKAVDMIKSLEKQGERGGNRAPMLEPQVNYIIWKDEKITQVSDNAMIDYQEEEESFYPDKKGLIEEKQSSDGSSFHTLAAKVNLNGEEVTVQFIRYINPEKIMLNRLIIIMTVGVIIGSVCAVIAGYFLAGRALVPIQKSWETQQQFVSDASHELRTPLAVIQTRTDLLFQEPEATIQDKALDISVISKETRRLIKLVANLLTLARSDSNQMEITKQAFSLTDLLNEVKEQYADIAEFQGKKIEVQLKNPIQLVGDKERIHQLLVILVDNSMKFTEEGGEIMMNAIEKTHTITLMLQDNGIGIPKEDIPKIFNRFYQVEQSRTNIEGTGLGLSIAKWIVDKHEGTIKVDSELDEGTTFEITFPKLG